jgi:hypothetical protein
MSTTRAFTGTEIQYNRRVEARPETPPVEPILDRRSAWQKSVDENAKALAERCKRAQAEREAIVRAKQAEQDKINKWAAYTSAELQVEQTFSVYGISPDDQKRIETQITALGLWARPAEAVEYAVGEAMKITADRTQASEAGIAKVRALCDDDVWAQVLKVLADNVGNFPDEQLANGRAHEIVYERLFE